MTRGAPSVERVRRHARRWPLLCGAIPVWIAACAGPSPADNVALDPRVLTLMECEECIQGERDTVIRMGAAAVPSLREALLHGPSARRLSVVDSSLRRLQPMPLAPLITFQLQSYRAMYTQRAADALGAIGGATAKAALCEAPAVVALSARDRTVVDSAIARIGGGCP